MLGNKNMVDCGILLEFLDGLFQPFQLCIHNESVNISTGPADLFGGRRIEIVGVQHNHGYVVVGIVEYIFFVGGKVYLCRIGIIKRTIFANGAILRINEVLSKNCL